jgi:hypothetical protein
MSHTEAQAYALAVLERGLTPLEVGTTHTGCAAVVFVYGQAEECRILLYAGRLSLN